MRDGHNPIEWLAALLLGGIGHRVIGWLRRVGAWGPAPAPEWAAFLIGVAVIALSVAVLIWIL